MVCVEKRTPVSYTHLDVYKRQDQACIDLVMQSDDPGREHFMERVNSRNGIHTIEAAAELGFGSRAYDLTEL